MKHYRCMTSKINVGILWHSTDNALPIYRLLQLTVTMPQIMTLCVHTWRPN